MRRTLMTIAASIATLGALTAHASAEPDSSIKYPDQITGSWYVVTSGSTTMRAGDQEVYYAVTTLKQGTMVVAASNDDRYAAVIYPLSFGALVPAGEVKVSGETVTLLEPSTLRAPSSLLGMSGSWKGLYADPLPTGTVLDIVETLESDSGQVVGYKVTPPRPPAASAHPVGFVKMSDLRPATTTEIEKFLGKPLTAQPVEIPEVETVLGTTTQAPSLLEEAGKAIETAAVDTSLMDEMSEPGMGGITLAEPEIIPEGIPEASDPEPIQITEELEPANPVETVTQTDPLVADIQFSSKDETAQPELIDDPVVINNTVIVPDKSASTPARSPTGSVLSVSALETLEASFAETRGLPRIELDNALEELLAEYTRTQDAAGDDKSLYVALGQRIEWLKIRMETRDMRRSIESTLRKADADQAAIESSIQQWQAGRSYILVGRMVPSAVYTGERLPLLYRVQGNDPLSGLQTTIGYIAPNPGEDYRHLLGRVVGVIGSAELDTALNLRIIRPSRIDAMPEQ